MFGLVSVTPRAAQRTLAGDLDRQHRMMAAQNAAPAAENISFFHCEPLLPLVGVEDLMDCGLRKDLATETQRHRDTEQFNTGWPLSFRALLCGSVALWLISAIRNPR